MQFNVQIKRIHVKDTHLPQQVCVGVCTRDLGGYLVFNNKAIIKQIGLLKLKHKQNGPQASQK